ncbi:hypothetical protein GG344DRAFT_47852, partial [Lentinula edodes]
SVSAQSLNPCGHSVCAPCAEKWLYDQCAGTCPVCRRQCNLIRPVITNITINNLVEKHIQLCALSGNVTWQNDGTKLISWMERSR